MSHLKTEQMLPELSKRAEGWLTKKAIKSGRNWRKRFFVLDGCDLSYYKDGTLKKQKGTMPLNAKSRVMCGPFASSSRPNLLEITWSTGTSLMLSAPTEAEQKMWQRAISSEVGRVAQQQSSVDIDIPFGLTTRGGKVVSGGGLRPFEEAETLGYKWRRPSFSAVTKEAQEMARHISSSARKEAKSHVQVEARKRAEKEKAEQEWERITMIRATSTLPKTASKMHMVDSFKGQEQK
jgi:hypothetical protein